MRRATELPAAFRRHQEIGGVLEFAVFDECDGTEHEIIDAIVDALGGDAAADREQLRALGGRPITERAFFGDWYDMDRRALIRVGNWTTDDGSELHDPLLRDLDDVRIMHGGHVIPAAGTGGQFAYAFIDPPYSLRAPSREVVALFDEVCAFIMPPGSPCALLDWSSERLVEVSESFADGMEWWGVFLFSIHVPALRRLTVVVGSSTD